MFVNKNRIIQIHTSAMSDMTDEDFNHIAKKRPKWCKSFNQFINQKLRKEFPLGYAQAIKASRGIDVVWDLHVNGNGWAHTGYQYIIEKDGTGKKSVCGNKKIRAYANGYTDPKYGFMNSANNCYHICIIGHGDFEPVNSHQMIELLRFLSINKDKFDLITWHTNHSSTVKSCAGAVQIPQLKKALKENGYKTE